MTYDLVIIGGGPAGLASAIKASKKGLEKILIIERDNTLGGILNQCIHNGFGLEIFKEELTGPEYAFKYIEKLKDTKVEVKSDTMVLKITKDKEVHYLNTKEGYQIINAKAIILAMGCRERTRGAISIPGSRPAGVYTAGSAQRYINIDGYLVGKKVVILGSGDIGLIMARRMVLEGAKVLAVVELMPYSNGLERNIKQCLNDFKIPLFLSHTVTKINGKDRVTSVEISKVDENKVPIKGSEFTLDCDTLLLSVGLIPENELSKEAGIKIDPRTNGPIVYDNFETSLPGVFACGNVLHVHDVVDFVSKEAKKASKGAINYLTNGEIKDYQLVEVKNGNLINYVLPQLIRKTKDLDKVKLAFRVKEPIKAKYLYLKEGNKVLEKIKIKEMLPAKMEAFEIDEDVLKKINKEIILEVGD